MSDPRFSVVLPTFDRLALLREAVDWVRAQTLREWELIVVDDGSGDGTAQYLEALAREEPRLVPIRLPHTGRIAAVRNAGLARARARWIAFLDSDDAWRADKLQRHDEAHRRTPRARWSYSGRALMDGAGNPLPDERYAPWHPYEGAIAERVLVHQARVAFPSLVAERSLIEALGGIDESLRFSSDYDLVLRLAAAAECVVIPEPLVRVRLHAASTTRGRVEVDESFIRVYRKFAATHRTPGVRRLCRRQIAQYQLWVARKRAAAGRPLGALRALAAALRDPAGARGALRMAAGWLARRLPGRRAVAPPGARP